MHFLNVMHVFLVLQESVEKPRVLLSLQTVVVEPAGAESGLLDLVLPPLADPECSKLLTLLLQVAAGCSKERRCSGKKKAREEGKIRDKAGNPDEDSLPLRLLLVHQFSVPQQGGGMTVGMAGPTGVFCDRGGFEQTGKGKVNYH